MGARLTTVRAYWAARWRDTGSALKDEIGGHVKTVIGTVAAAFLGPPFLRLLPAFSGRSNLSAWEKLKADFWENVLIGVVVIAAILLVTIVVAILRAPYRVWRTSVVELNSGNARVVELEKERDELKAGQVVEHRHSGEVQLVPSPQLLQLLGNQLDRPLAGVVTTAASGSAEVVPPTETETQPEGDQQPSSPPPPPPPSSESPRGASK